MNLAFINTSKKTEKRVSVAEERRLTAKAERFFSLSYHTLVPQGFHASLQANTKLNFKINSNEKNQNAHNILA